MAIHAIGNDGTVYTLEKLPTFQASKAAHKFIRCLTELEEQLFSEAELIQHLEKFYMGIPLTNLAARYSLSLHDVIIGSRLHLDSVLQKSVKQHTPAF